MVASSQKDEVVVSKQYCPACGFLMMYEVKEDQIMYTCVNNQHEIGDSQGVHMSENMLDAYKALGTNVDILMEFLKRP